MTDLFYRAFEEKFRGSRSLIRSRLDVYRAFISPLKQIYSDARGLDLGCGRGEWLEVLQEEGIEPLGIDLDEGMLEACRALHLPAVKGDAVAYLAALPNESQAIISAFHMVEHIPFDQLQVIVSESLRVLKPGGLLIMETPNPENIAVATRDFYLDPTHQRPIPPLLLSFLPEYYGFQRSKILRLQQSARLEQDTDPSLIDVLEGASPDYAVVAQKRGPADILERSDQAFAKEIGLTLNELCERHDQANAMVRSWVATHLELEAKVEHAIEANAMLRSAHLELEAKVEHAIEANATLRSWIAAHGELEAKVEHAIEANATLRSWIAAHGELEAKVEHAIELAAHAQDRAMHMEQAFQSLHASRSWQLTRPLRWASLQLRLLRTHGPQERLTALVRKLTGRRVIPTVDTNRAGRDDVSAQTQLESVPLSPHARTIYLQLINKINASQD